MLDFELSIFVIISGYLTVVRIVVILLDITYIAEYPKWATLQLLKTRFLFAFGFEICSNHMSSLLFWLVYSSQWVNAALQPVVSELLGSAVEI